jgi:hypothetical protein
MSAQRSIVAKHVSVENETVNVVEESESKKSNYSYSQKGLVARNYIDTLMNNVKNQNETEPSYDQNNSIEQFDKSLVNESQKIGLIDAISHINVTEESI